MSGATYNTIPFVPPVGSAEFKYLLAKRPRPPRTFVAVAREEGLDPSMISHWAAGRKESPRLEKKFARLLRLSREEVRRLRAA
jgi:hypothetical protein